MSDTKDNQVTENKQAGIFSYWCDYYELCKPRVVMLLVFTAVIGMFLAIPPTQTPDWGLIIIASIGIGLASASAVALATFLSLRTKERNQHQGAMTGIPT